MVQGTHTPLGIAQPIVARGVFPWADITKAHEASAEYLAALDGYNKIDKNPFMSITPNPEADSGHLEPVGTWEEVTSRWPDAKATKLATLVKQKPDGTYKVRFIADMRRSGVNGLTYTEEKIVFPRGTDLTRDILDSISWKEVPPHKDGGCPP